MRNIVKMGVVGLCMALASLGCEDPNISEYEPRTGVISGTLLYRVPTLSHPCMDSLPQGRVLILLFDANNPPPPRGTGSPVNFIVVPPEKIFGSGQEPADGVYASPFVMSGVKAGNYLISAFMDADGDFNPAIDLLAQPSAGDVGGGYVDLATGQSIVVSVGQGELVEQITVNLGLPVLNERPAFVHSSTVTFTVPYAASQSLVLSAQSIEGASINTRAECSHFTVQYADADGDGKVDDVNGDQLPDLYPQVLLVRQPTADFPGTVIIPTIINPYPFMQGLAANPSGVQTDTLELILPPVAIERGDFGQRLLPSVPAGQYSTVVISGSGQTWTVPNSLNQLQPSPARPDQSVLVEMKAGPALPEGTIRGSLEVPTSTRANGFVVAFPASDPPPPQGTGRPVALASIAKENFSDGGAGRLMGSFELRGLADGDYILVGLYDIDANFSPLVDLVAQSSAGDYSGATPAPVRVSSGSAPPVAINLSRQIPSDRPVFRIQGPRELERNAFPTTISLASHGVGLLGISARSAAPTIQLSGTDLDGDNLPDLYPRVLLTKMVESGPAETAPDSPEGIAIVGLVNPVPYLGALGNGVPAVREVNYQVILPPIALRLTTGERISPPPAGRYRINVLSGTGQTWSVPNNLSQQLSLEGVQIDATQGQFITVKDSPIPRGSIEGSLQLAGVTPPAGDFQVIVFAFRADALPPPLGSGRPVAIDVVSKGEFMGGGSADYQLRGLSDGNYQVRAFLDADDDFTPWFGTHNQPTAGDFGGGAVDMQGRFLSLNVDSLGQPTNAPVVISATANYPGERPSFVMPETTLSLTTGSVAVSLTALRANTSLLTTQGSFPVSWIDVNGDGLGDDINGDRIPDVYPIVVAELLDEVDPSGQTVSPEGIRIPGFIDPRQFAPLGFPAGDPTQTGVLIAVSQFNVVFPGLAVSTSTPTPMVAPVGNYRVTLINAFGQTWTLPNELAFARDTPLAASQGTLLKVRR